MRLFLKTARFMEIAKWFGTCLFAIGAAFIALSPKLSSLWYPFSLFLIGHITWSVVGLKMRDSAILWMNLMYMPFDVYAIIVRIQ
jgi:hypothetical protein